MTQPVIFYAYYKDSTNLDGETGLTVTLDVFRTTKATGAVSQIVTGASATEVGDGIYLYAYATADMLTYDYATVFKTAASTVQDKWIPGLRHEDSHYTVSEELLTGTTHNTNNSLGKRIRQLASPAIYTGTVVSSTNNSVTLDAGASSVDGSYDPACIDVAGQSRGIPQYDGATRTVWVDRKWRVNPSPGDEFTISAWPGREHVNEGVAQGGGANYIILNVNASDEDHVYEGQVVFLRSGTGEDQYGNCIAYEGATHKATVQDLWAVIPDTTTVYAMLPTGAMSYKYLATAVLNALLADHNVASTFGAKINAILSSTQTAQAVLNATASSYDTAGSIGEQINNAGGATDPLTNTLGSYTAGTAGAALQYLGGAQVTVTGPVAQTGNVNTYQGDFYTGARALLWTKSGSDLWPATLAGYTILVSVKNNDGEVLEFTGSVVTATGSGQQVKLELTGTQSASIDLGSLYYQVRAKLPNVVPGGDPTDVATLARGSWVSEEALEETA